MARIDRKQDGTERGRIGGGYERLFGDEELGLLISKVQSAVISSGTELEKLIRCKVQTIEALDEFIEAEIMPDGIFLADKKQIKKSERSCNFGSEPDFIIFRRRENQQRCHIVELKDGDNFDTKKAAAERRSMHDFISANGCKSALRRIFTFLFFQSRQSGGHCYRLQEQDNYRGSNDWQRILRLA